MIRKKFFECMELVGSPPTKYAGEKTYVSTGALDCDHIDYEATEQVSYEKRPSRANLVAEPGDILFAKMCATKKTLQLDGITKEYLFSTGFFAVRANESVIIPKLLYYLLGSDQFLLQRDKYSSGATQKAITNAGLGKILIQIPALVEQPRIVAILDKLDSLLSLRKQQLAKLDDLVKAQFLEMFGDPVQNEKSWKTYSLDSVCTSIVDCPHSTPNYTTENTGYMCIRTSIVKKNQILWDKIEYIPENEYYLRIQRKRPEKGDIVYTREGAILGIAAMIDRNCNVALGQRSMLLSPNPKYCCSQFLCVAMNFDSFLNKALEGLGGSASPHINVGDIKSFQIIVPPIELQERFVRFVEKSKEQRLTIQRSLDKLEMLKKALFQEYFG